MRNLPLNQRRVDSLKPRRATYDIRDTDLKGFGIRVLPSGRKSYFLHTQYEGRRRWTTIGDADAMSETEARSQARSVLAGVREGREGAPRTAGGHRLRGRRRPGVRALPEALETAHARRQPELLREPYPAVVQGTAGRRHHAAGRAGMVRVASREAGLGQPVAAGAVGHPAAGRGLRIPAGGQQPLQGHQALPPPRAGTLPSRRTRSAASSRSWTGKTRRARPRRPSSGFLLLTGCRKGEVLTLKWRDYREGKLFLRDGKNGPRTVWLSSAAREVLDRLPRTSAWVFPSRHSHSGHLSEIAEFWGDVRTEAGLSDVRPHDLRHTYASIALMHGETVLTIGRLLGHDHPGTTLRYTNFADAAAREAVDCRLAGPSGGV